MLTGFIEWFHSKGIYRNESDGDEYFKLPTDCTEYLFSETAQRNTLTQSYHV